MKSAHNYFRDLKLRKKIRTFSGIKNNNSLSKNSLGTDNHSSSGMCKCAELF